MHDELAALLQREIDASRHDIDMRTRLVHAMAAYNEALRVARDMLYSDVMAAFSRGYPPHPQHRYTPSAAEIQAAMDQHRRRN